MAKGTSITWCHHTFNAWRGCTKLSPGCKNCYAEKLDRRNLWGGGRTWGDDAPRIPASEMQWAELRSWARAALRANQRRRVFCGSVCDVGEEHPDTVYPRARLAQTIERIEGLDFLLLSKRPENFDRLFAWSIGRPPPWVWLGASVEDQDATARIGHLLRQRARIRFLSVEPLLGPVNLHLDRGLPCDTCKGAGRLCPDCGGGGVRRIDWVIVGGESGAGARGCNLEWIEGVVEQCRIHGVAPFVKQLGSAPFVTQFGRVFSMGTKGKGEDPALWPPGHDRLFADPVKCTPRRELPSRANPPAVAVGGAAAIAAGLCEPLTLPGLALGPERRS
jgi:protein gp37